MLRKKGIIIVFLVAGIFQSLFSQHLSHQVMVSAGGNKTTGGYSLSQSMGEAAVEILSQDFVLTQGFQQPRIIFSVIQPPGNGVDVYPNPASDNLVLKFFGDIDRDYRIEIMTMTGIPVISDELSFAGTYFLEKVVPVRNLRSGLYLISITSKDNLIKRTFKIEKL